MAVQLAGDRHAGGSLSAKTLFPVVAPTVGNAKFVR